MKLRVLLLAKQNTRVGAGIPKTPGELLKNSRQVFSALPPAAPLLGQLHA
jgi:hypothetical protein